MLRQPVKRWSVTYSDKFGGLHEIRNVEATDADKAKVEANKMLYSLFKKQALERLELEWEATEEE